MERYLFFLRAKTEVFAAKVKKKLKLRYLIQVKVMIEVKVEVNLSASRRPLSDPLNQSSSQIRRWADAFRRIRSCEPKCLKGDEFMSIFEIVL